MDLGQGSEDPLEVVGEAHVEHLVRLVEHHGLDLVQADRRSLQVVHRAAGRRHDDVHAPGQPVQLRRDRLPAVHGHHARAELAAVAVHRLGDLHRQLAGRREHERPGPAAPLPVPRRAPRVDRRALGPQVVELDGEPVQHRERERGGLARAGGRLGQQVLAREQRRDRLELDRRRLLVAQAPQRPEQPGVEVERGEAGSLRRERPSLPSTGLVGVAVAFVDRSRIVVWGHPQIVAPNAARAPESTAGGPASNLVGNT